jgi:hypothetical protein
VEFVDEYLWKAEWKNPIINYSVNNSVQKIIKLFKRIINKYKIECIVKANTLIFDSFKTFNILKNNFNFIDFKNKLIKIIPPPIETDLFKYTEPNKKEIFELLTVGYITKRMEKNNRKFAIERFSIENTIKEWLNAYQETYDKFL